jgi:hypothetical protein
MWQKNTTLLQVGLIKKIIYSILLGWRRPLVGRPTTIYTETPRLSQQRLQIENPTTYVPIFYMRGDRREAHWGRHVKILGEPTPTRSPSPFSPPPRSGAPQRRGSLYKRVVVVRERYERHKRGMTQPQPPNSFDVLKMRIWMVCDQQFGSVRCFEK